MTYYDQKLRLAERFITRSLRESPETIITFDDLRYNYESFALNHALSDEELITLLLDRFPATVIDYGLGVIRGLVWVDQLKEYVPESPKIDPKTRQLDLRLERMLALYPKYKEDGITIAQFAAWQKESIAGGWTKLEFEKISIDDAKEYLDANPRMKKINNKYYQMVGSTA